jgi:hypothetical protein
MRDQHIFFRVTALETTCCEPDVMRGIGRRKGTAGGPAASVQAGARWIGVSALRSSGGPTIIPDGECRGSIRKRRAWFTKCNGVSRCAAVPRRAAVCYDVLRRKYGVLQCSVMCISLQRECTMCNDVCSMPRLANGLPARAKSRFVNHAHGGYHTT